MNSTLFSSIPHAGAASPLWAAWYWDALGWCVVPAHGIYRARSGELVCGCQSRTCDKAGKHPLYLHNRNIPRYTLRNGWPSYEPYPNLALLAGWRSGVVVADIDPRHGGTLAALWALGWSPDTVVAHTGGGGWHVYAACPPDGLRSVDAYAPGIELKANGKYVILPPSLHSSKHAYVWAHGHAPWQVAPAALPPAVLAATGAHRAQVRQGTPHRAPRASAVPPPAVDPEEISARMPRAMEWIDAAVARAHARADNGRHGTLVWLANRLALLGLRDAALRDCLLLYQERVKAGWAE